MLFRACSYAAYTSLLFEPQEHTKKSRPSSKVKNLGLKKSGCLEVLICLYESISLCAAGFDATLSRKKSTSNTSSSFVSFLSTTSCQMGSHPEISWNIMKCLLSVSVPSVFQFFHLSGHSTWHLLLLLHPEASASRLCCHSTKHATVEYDLDATSNLSQLC